MACSSRIEELVLIKHFLFGSFSIIEKHFPAKPSKRYKSKFCNFLKSKQELLLFVICGFSGALAEIIAIYFGAWNYSNSIKTIPFWLPILWGIAALYITRLNKDIQKLIVSKKC